MLHFITNAPLDTARNVASVGGWAEPDGQRSVLHLPERFAHLAVTFLASEGFTVEVHRPRPAIGDPTASMAMAAIDRSR